MKKATIYILTFWFVLMTSVVFGKDFTVVIDAGHGGKDSGTVSRSKRHHHEKVIVLKIAKKLGSYIKKNCPDVKVLYTRTKDVYPSFKKRSSIANKANADLFISIHVDAVENAPKVHGASVYVLGLHRTKDNLRVAMRENAVMLQEKDYKTKYAGFDPNDSESYIIFNLMQNQHLDNSMFFANLVNKHLKKETKRYTKGVRQAGFYVLREVGMPSVLVETGYITNNSDADYLCSKKGQSETALAIFKAFKEYKKYITEHTADLTKTKKKETKTKKKEKETKNKKTDNFFAVQILYSGKNLSGKSKHFKGLSPVQKIKKGKAYYYVYGQTQNYQKALELQQKARKVIPDAYLVGVQNGRIVKYSKVRKALNSK